MITVSLFAEDTDLEQTRRLNLEESHPTSVEINRAAYEMFRGERTPEDVVEVVREAEAVELPEEVEDFLTSLTREEVEWMAEHLPDGSLDLIGYVTGAEEGDEALEAARRARDAIELADDPGWEICVREDDLTTQVEALMIAEE